MSSIDEEIRQALSQEDRKLLAEIDEEPGLFELVGMSFKGRQAWMTWYMWVMGFVVFGLCVYAVIAFLDEPDLKASLGWALVTMACIQVLAIVKVISWQQMQKLEIMRELKRLEMRLLMKHD